MYMLLSSAFGDAFAKIWAALTSQTALIVYAAAALAVIVSLIIHTIIV